MGTVNICVEVSRTSNFALLVNILFHKSEKINGLKK